MDTTDFRGYLALLRELGQTLEHLTEIEQKKTAAVRQDNLDILNECMKQEQALNLILRGYDQKREALLSSLDLSGVPLSSLLPRAPEDCREETRKTVETLRRQYELFSGAYEVARNTLEINLHQVEQVLADLDYGTEAGPGYQEGNPDIPLPIQTDFRA